MSDVFSDGPAEGDGDIAPYAGGQVEYTNTGGRSSAGQPGIEADFLHSTYSGYPQPATSVEPYAMDPRNTASDETDEQLRDTNTARGPRGPVDPEVVVAFTNDSSLDVPGSVEPYAGDPRTIASDRSGEGL